MLPYVELSQYADKVISILADAGLTYAEAIQVLEIATAELGEKAIVKG